MPPRIIIASTLFNERSHYMEVVAATALARMGCDVLVVTAKHVPSGQVQPWKVAVVTKCLRIRDTIFFPRGLDRIISGFRPDAAFLFAPNHGLSYALHQHLPPGCLRIPVFGDLRESDTSRRGRWLSVRGNPLMKRLVKDRWYRRVMQQSELILASTNETVRILREVDAGSWDKRGLMCGLPVDPDVFFHDPAARKSGWKTIATATRIVPHKPVKEWIQPVLRFLRKHEDWRYVFAGLPPGAAGEAVRQELRDAGLGDRFELRPLLRLPEMNALFNEADVAVWYLAAVSIQQSMLTGIPVLLPADEALNHLVKPGVNGFYYDTPAHLEQQLEAAGARTWDRAEIAAGNAWMAAGRMFRDIVRRLGLGLPDEGVKP
jgi:glycosyltransferase involved in cell wall biosynthesis